MTVLRTIVLAVLLALGTVLVAWWAVPLVAAAFGAITHATRRPGLSAAVAGVLAWGGYLGIAALGGAPVGVFGVRLAASMQLPGWAPITATILFPAVLAGLASYLGARVGGRYLSPT